MNHWERINPSVSLSWWNQTAQVCPTSSIMTGGVNLKSVSSHTVVQFAKDKVSYSINTDGPLMTGRWLQEEYRFCLTNLGLTARDLETSKLNAAKAAFLDNEEDRTRLIEHIRSFWAVIGFLSNTSLCASGVKLFFRKTELPTDLYSTKYTFGRAFSTELAGKMK